MKSNVVFMALVLFTGIVMLLVDFLALVFFGNVSSGILLRFGLPALAFLAVYCAVLGRNARCFRQAYKTKPSSRNPAHPQSFRNSRDPL